MKDPSVAPILLALVYIGLIFAAFIGWAMNLIEVINMAFDSSPLTSEFVIRIVGVPVAILGAVLGWF